MWNGHFTNISFEIWIQSLNVYGLFGFLDDLGGILDERLHIELSFLQVTSKSIEK